LNEGELFEGRKPLTIDKSMVYPILFWGMILKDDDVESETKFPRRKARFGVGLHF
jgi:hypothetical protein